MKYFCSVLLFLFPVLSLWSADENLPQRRFSPESAVSSGADITLISENLIITVDSLNAVKKKFLSSANASKFDKYFRSFRKSTSCDILSVDDLANLGFSKSGKNIVTMSLSDEGKKEFTVFLPVTDPGSFPLDFVRFLKKSSDFPYSKDHPAVSAYGDVTVYKFGYDVFFCTIENYFVLSSSFASISMAVDLSSGKGNSLISDPDFLKARSKSISSMENLFVWHSNRAFQFAENLAGKFLLKMIPDNMKYGLGMNFLTDTVSISYYISGNEQKIDDLKKIFPSFEMKNRKNFQFAGLLNISLQGMKTYINKYPDSTFSINMKKFFKLENLETDINSSDETACISVETAGITGSDKKQLYVKYRSYRDSAKRFFASICALTGISDEFRQKNPESGNEYVRIIRNEMSEVFMILHDETVIFSMDGNINIDEEKTKEIKYSGKTSPGAIKNNCFIIYYFGHDIENNIVSGISDYIFNDESMLSYFSDQLSSGVFTGDFSSGVMTLNLKSLVK